MSRAKSTFAAAGAGAAPFALTPHHKSAASDRARFRAAYRPFDPLAAGRCHSRIRIVPGLVLKSLPSILSWTMAAGHARRVSVRQRHQGLRGARVIPEHSIPGEEV